MVLVPECKVDVKGGKVSGMVEWSLERGNGGGGHDAAAGGGGGVGDCGSSAGGAASKIVARRGGLLMLNFSNKHSWRRSNSVKYTIKLVPGEAGGEEEEEEEEEEEA